MRDRSRFHADFIEALQGDVSALAPWLAGAEGQLRFSVYRNTVAKGLSDALLAQFPTVTKVMGEAWMREAALRFARRHPPVSASLLAYGQAFPDWLETYPDAAETAWLADLARLDEAWRSSFFAADLEPLPAQALTRLEPSQFTHVAAELHPACVFRVFADGIPTLWLALQADDHPPELELAEGAEAMAFLRPDTEVSPIVLSPGGGAFLAACARGRSLADAAEAALAREAGVDLTTLFSTLIAGGAFARLIANVFKD